MPTNQHLASLQWKAEEGQEVDERFGSFFFFQIRTTVDHGIHPHHVDRAGACCSLAVLLWVAHRLVVVGLVEGVQRRVDQVDHQHRIHLSEELTDLDQQNTQTQTNAEPRARAPLAKRRKMEPFLGCLAQPFTRAPLSWSRTITVSAR